VRAHDRHNYGATRSHILTKISSDRLISVQSRVAAAHAGFEGSASARSMPVAVAPAAEQVLPSAGGPASTTFRSGYGGGGCGGGGSGWIVYQNDGFYSCLACITKVVGGVRGAVAGCGH